MADPLSTDDPLSLGNGPRRPTGAEQWQQAITAQQQRNLAKPSTGEQIGNVINWNIDRAVHGNPLAQIAQMYQDIRSGQLDPLSPEAGGRGLRQALSMVLEGVPYAQAGAVGTGGGKPFWENMKGVRMPPIEANRLGVLDKLIANKDFRPTLRAGRIWFESLSPAENEVMNNIRWSRANNVTWQDETHPERSSWAWEQNIRHWRNLAAPPKDKA